MLSQGKSLLSLVAGHLVWNQLKYSQSFQDLEQVLLEFDERIPLIKDAAQVKYMCDIVEFISNELSTVLVLSSVTCAVMWLFIVSCITIFTGADRNFKTETGGDCLCELHLVSVRTA